ncbi:hypothetical protein [Amycolatopsis sp. GM8]|uniref:hypothetical protein n=1 Tax=Amycolatopsis sp. GM8 TaxID=2896530 RepID=UPI001F2EA02A|nr:hypothetical protein [Amycolatopsis sp. GM8]
MNSRNPMMPEAERRARAVRAVAGSARDAADLKELLDILGLAATDVLPPPSRVPRQRGAHLSIEELHALPETAARPGAPEVHCGPQPASCGRTTSTGHRA